MRTWIWVAGAAVLITIVVVSALTRMQLPVRDTSAAPWVFPYEDRVPDSPGIVRADWLSQYEGPFPVHGRHGVGWSWGYLWLDASTTQKMLTKYSGWTAVPPSEAPDYVCPSLPAGPLTWLRSRDFEEHCGMLETTPPSYSGVRYIEPSAHILYFECETPE